MQCRAPALCSDAAACRRCGDCRRPCRAESALASCSDVSRSLASMREQQAGGQQAGLALKCPTQPQVRRQWAV